MDMGIHDLDIVRWLMGSEIVEIYARGAVLKYDFLKQMNDVDHGQMLLKFANGATAVSYTQLDVYKRQSGYRGGGRPPGHQQRPEGF